MLRWGIVGYGWVARDYMRPGIDLAGDCVLAVCDPDPSARAAAAACGIDVCADIDEMLRLRPDAVYVATPNDLHRRTVETCLDAAVPVLCEKPMAATLDDAEAMVLAATRTGVLLGTAFDQRHHPAHKAIRDTIALGGLGTVTAIRIVYACWLGRDWCGNEANWRIDAGRAGGGAVMDLAPHGIDLVDALLGEPIVDLVGRLQRRVHDYDVDDGGMLVGRTASGVLVAIHNSYNVPETLPRRRLEIAGTRGQIVALDTMGQTAGGRVTLTEAANRGETQIMFNEIASPFTRQAQAFATAVRGAQHDFDAVRDLAAMRLIASLYEEEVQHAAHRKVVA